MRKWENLKEGMPAPPNNRWTVGHKYLKAARALGGVSQRVCLAFPLPNSHLSATWSRASWRVGKGFITTVGGGNFASPFLLFTPTDYLVACRGARGKEFVYWSEGLRSLSF